MSDLSDQIEENAAAPRQISVDGQSVSEHSLPDQIAADRYLQEKAAATSRKLPVGRFRIRPGGTT